MKKFAKAFVAGVMALSLVACSGNGGSNAPASSASAGGESAIKIAMVTDSGDITDQSFNQTTYEACKKYAEANNVEFTYKKPAANEQTDRSAAIEEAIDEGYNVIVLPGYLFGASIAEVAPSYPDIKFVALDVSQGDLGEDFNSNNVYCAIYQEELCGFMAGYAAVKLGYKKLGFLGGMAVPAVQRYGYGFVQGADAAAAELGLTDVECKYVYGGQFYGDSDITARMDTWCADGTEIIFACGGGIYTSAAEAEKKIGGKIIGVDVDQSGIIDADYGTGITVTSAMKGLAATVNKLLSEIQAGNWNAYAGKVESLGLVGEDVTANYVGLPETTQWADGKFTQDDYKQIVADLYNGKISVSADVSVTAESLAKTIKVKDEGSIKG